MRKRNQLSFGIFIFALGVFSFQCESQKKTPPYWLLALLEQKKADTSSSAPQEDAPTVTSGETPGENPQARQKIYITAENVPPVNASGTCQTYGGLLISFSNDTVSTCTVANLTPTCFSQIMEDHGLPRTLDPRSYVGYELPTHEEVDLAFPSDQKSVLHCYDRPKPSSLSSVLMYAYRDRSPHPLVSTCYQRMNGQHCRDTLKLSTPTSFTLPREFVIWSEDGDGNAGSHMLQVRFIKENGKFTTCTYGGNYYLQTSGFTRNAYISGNVSEQYMRGYCIECSTGFCDNQINSGNGPFSFESSYLIPVGSPIIAKDSIYLAVLNGEGQKKHSVRWTVEGFSPTEASLDFTSLAGLVSGPYQSHFAWMLSGTIFVLFLFSFFMRRKRRTRREH